jgi:ABC-2 type transport system ATP-binding protein
MDAVVESGMTVLLSSHILSDLERVCDYLIILAAAHVQLAGDIQEIVRTHKRLIGPRQDEAAVTALASVHTVIEASHTDRQTTLLVRTTGPLFDPSWDAQAVSLEDIVLAYLSLGRQVTESVPLPPTTPEPMGRNQQRMEVVQ